MYKILPQMHRLVKQICKEYGLTVADIIIDIEGAADYATSTPNRYPYYIVKLEPNEKDWLFISCRPKRGRYVDFSASQNNVTCVIYPHSAHGEPFVLPSWRGKIVPPEEMHLHRYHIGRGYMDTRYMPDPFERRFIQEYFKAHAEA